MRHLTANPTALVLGAIVGVAAGFYAHYSAHRAVADTSGTGTANGTSRVPPIYALASIGTAAGLLIAARFGMTATLPAYLYVVAIAPALGVVDAVSRRLPNAILLPSYPLAVLLLGIAALKADDPAAFWRSLLAGAAVYAFLLLFALAAPPRSLGWGDVKLVGVLGLFLGFLGWATVWRGIMISFGLAALYVVLRALVRHGQRGRTLPLGPALLLGSLAAVIFS